MDGRDGYISFESLDLPGRFIGHYNLLGVLREDSYITGGAPPVSWLPVKL